MQQIPRKTDYFAVSDLRNSGQNLGLLKYAFIGCN